jgi:hypothetical protein
MANYQLTTGTYITRTADGASIPADPLNADYRVYLAWVAAGNTPDPAPPAPAPTLPQQAEALLSSGLTITSTSTPALNGTYPATPTAVSYVQAEMLSVLINGTFADGETTLQWADATGTLHTFPNVAVFKAFATAVGAFVAAATKVEIGASTTLPPASATIA